LTAPRLRRLLVTRVAGALALRPQTYRDVAADESAGIQAGLLVVLVGVIEASVSSSTHGEPALDTGTVLYCVAAALIGWLVWSGILLAVGGRLFEQPVEFRPLLRAVAFAHAPGIVYGVAAYPGLTAWAGLILVLSLLWFVAALAACVRGALEFAPSRALAITGASLLTHEVIHQALRLGGVMP
jgi:hypothetical protein